MAHRITRDDLEARFRKLQGDAQAKVNDKKQTLITAAAAGGVLVVVIFFLLGRRSGKKQTTLVEIRRV
jgi:hypothetical protein